MHDCWAMLEGQRLLEGRGNLRWGLNRPIDQWEGVTTGRADYRGGSASRNIEASGTRVTRIDLAGADLSGSIPAWLGELRGLTRLDLSDNALTGSIPLELTNLENLEVLRLSGNSLTGCIPRSLWDAATNDLADLNLPDCTGN